MRKYVSISVIILAMLSNTDMCMCPGKRPHKGPPKKSAPKKPAPKKKPKKQVATSSSAAVDKFPLHTAARAGDIEQVQYLVEQRPNSINLRDSNGRTPIMEAAANGRSVVVEYLAGLKAELELHDNTDRTAFLLAAGNGHYMVAAFLTSLHPETIKKDAIVTGFWLACYAYKKNCVLM